MSKFKLIKTNYDLMGSTVIIFSQMHFDNFLGI